MKYVTSVIGVYVGISCTPEQNRYHCFDEIHDRIKLLFTFCAVTYLNVSVYYELPIIIVHAGNSVIEDKYANRCGNTISTFQVQSLIVIICFQYLSLCYRNPQGLLLSVPDASQIEEVVAKLLTVQWKRQLKVIIPNIWSKVRHLLTKIREAVADSHLF